MPTTIAALTRCARATICETTLSNKRPVRADRLQHMSDLFVSTFGITNDQLLTEMIKRTRARVTLEGVVAEVHAERHILAVRTDGLIAGYDWHDKDNHPDFSIHLADRSATLRIEIKNVRNIGYQVETWKTRNTSGDPSNRYYSVDKWEILGVCLGKKTGDWTQFMWIASRNLARHPLYEHKMDKMHDVPRPGQQFIEPWYESLAELIANY